MKGEQARFDDIRFFLYITNDRDLTAEQVVFEANDRCNQENLIEQLENGVRALHAPVNSLNANGMRAALEGLTVPITLMSQSEKAR